MTDPAAIARLGFTGTQHRNTASQLDAMLSALIGFREQGIAWMHNGDCVNSDERAGDYWRTLGGMIHLHPPIIDAKRAFLRYEKMEPAKAYLARNRDIVNACTILLATPREFDKQPRGGTWSTIRYARLRNVPTMIIWPDGTHLLNAAGGGSGADG